MVTQREVAPAGNDADARVAMLAEVLGPLAHEFNNSFSVVLGALDLLGEHCDPSDEEAQTLLDDALGAGREGVALLERLVACAGIAPLRPVATDSGAVLARVASLLEVSLPSGISLDVDCARPAPQVMADPRALESALIEVAVNAREAMPEGGRLSVAATPAEGGRAVEFTVADTGTGIDAADRDRIFEPFFTTRRPRKRRGLGLGIVRGFAVRSRGSVTVTSVPGSGTRVKLALPASD